MFESPFFSSNAAVDVALKAFAPVARLSEITAQSFEKLATFQTQAAIAMVSHAAARLQTTAQAGSPTLFVARHAELTADFFNKSNQKWQEFLKIATDVQTDVTKWADDAKTQIEASFPKAA